MTVDETQQLAARLAALEARLASDAAEALRVQAVMDTPPAPPKGAGFNKEAAFRQEKLLYERRRRHAEWAQAHEEQLVRVQPQIDQLNAKARELEAKRTEMDRRHAAAAAKLGAEIAALSSERAKLMEPPPQPEEPVSETAEEAVVIYAEGHTQLIPRAQYEKFAAQKRQRRER